MQSYLAESDTKYKILNASEFTQRHLNGFSLFTGDAGQGESNIRRWIIENDWLEAIVALPLNLFYNTGIATYIWVLSNRKPDHRKGQVQLIDASQWFKPLRKNLGQKNCELSADDIDRITRSYLNFEESSESKIFPNQAFGYWKVVVERPLRLHSQLSHSRIEPLRSRHSNSKSPPPTSSRSSRPLAGAMKPPARHRQDPQARQSPARSLPRPLRNQNQR